MSELKKIELVKCPICDEEFPVNQPGALVALGADIDAIRCAKCMEREAQHRRRDGVATDVAHQWLKRGREESNGPISGWTTEEMERYHTDLGLLVDFVTDCWVNKCHWHQTESHWEGECGLAWEFTTGTPETNGFKFCPKCGRGVETTVSKEAE